MQASTAGLLHLDRLDTQEPLGAGTVDPPPFVFLPKNSQADFLLAAQGLFGVRPRVPAEITPLDPSQSVNLDSAPM